MLFFRQKKAILQQKKNYIEEVNYKLFKLFVIFLKWNTLLANLLLKKRSSFYYHNICIFSKKAKSISRKLKVSRIIIRELSNKGLFFGLYKASW